MKRSLNRFVLVLLAIICTTTPYAQNATAQKTFPSRLESATDGPSAQSDPGKRGGAGVTTPGAIPAPAHSTALERSSSGELAVSLDDRFGSVNVPCQYMPRSYDDCAPDDLIRVDAVSLSSKCSPSWADNYVDACFDFFEQRDHNQERFDNLEGACEGRNVTINVPPGFLEDAPAPAFGSSVRSLSREMTISQVDVLDPELVWPAMTYCEEPYDFTTERFNTFNVSLTGQSRALSTYGAALGVGLSRDDSGVVSVVDTLPVRQTTVSNNALSTVSSSYPLGASGVGLTPVSSLVDRSDMLDRVFDTRLGEITDFMDEMMPPGYEPQRYNISPRYSSVFLQPLNVLSEARQRWEDNGTAIDSCEEYAFERFYRYGKYEDLSAMLGNNYRMQFDVAYGSGLSHLVDPDGEAIIAYENVLDRKDPIWTENDPSNASVVTAGETTFIDLVDLYSNLMASRDTPSPKNGFFAIDFPEKGLMNLPNVGQVLGGISREGFVSECGGLQSAFLLEECLAKDDWFYASILLNGPVLLDDGLHNRIKAARAAEKTQRVVHDFDWHEQMSDELLDSGYSDQQLYVYDDLKAELQRLMDERNAIVEALPKSKTRWTFPQEEIVIGDPRDRLDWPVLENRLKDGLSWGDVSVDPVSNQNAVQDVFLKAAIAGLSPQEMTKQARMLHSQSLTATELKSAIRLLDQAFGFSPNVKVMGGTAKTPLSGTLPGGMTPLRTSATSMSTPAAPARMTSTGSGVTVQPSDFGSLLAALGPAQKSIAAQLYYIDRALESLLEKAEIAGCYDLETSPCDWSPKLFVQSLRFKVAPLRERALNECVRVTHGLAFDDIDTWDPKMACGKSVRDLYNIQAGYYGDAWDTQVATHTQHFDDFLNRRRQACFEAAADAYRKVAELQQSGKGNGDDASMGNSIVSAGYNYDFGYGVDYLAQHVSGYAGKQPANIPNVGARFGGSFESWMTLFGKELRLLDMTAGAVATDKDQYADVEVKFGGSTVYDSHDDGPGAELNMTIEEVKTWFTIGPVPVSVTAGVAGNMGVAFEGKASYKAKAVAPDPADTNPIDITAGVALTPRAGLDLYASAAVDVYLASVGVRADLNVLSVSLPLTLGLHIYGDEDVSGDSINTENLNMDFQTQMDAVLSTLDGEMSLYAKVGKSPLKKTFRKKLFGWSGPRHTLELFNYEKPLFQGGEVTLKEMRSDGQIPDPTEWPDANPSGN